MKIKRLIFVVPASVLASNDSFDQFVCRSKYSDFCGKADEAHDREITTSYTVNQYIVTGPPSAYFCSLAYACRSSPFGAAEIKSTYDYDITSMSEIVQLASQLDTNECMSVITKLKEGYAERSVGICGRLENAILECPRMPLMVFNNEAVVKAVERDYSWGSYWENPPSDSVDLNDWMQCGTKAQLLFSTKGRNDMAAGWNNIEYSVHWTGDDPPTSTSTCTGTGPLHDDNTCGGMCYRGWLMWEWANNPAIDTGLPSLVARYEGTEYPKIVGGNWSEKCRDGSCDALPWTNNFSGSIHYITETNRSSEIDSGTDQSRETNGVNKEASSPEEPSQTMTTVVPELPCTGDPGSCGKYDAVGKLQCNEIEGCTWMDNPICTQICTYGICSNFCGKGVGCYGEPVPCGNFATDPNKCIKQGCEYKGRLRSGSGGMISRRSQFSILMLLCLFLAK